MGCTQTLIANFDDVGKGFGLSSAVVVDRDEVLRQAFETIAGDQYAAEMEWKPVEFTGMVRWLGEHLESFRKDEEEDGRGMAWYVG